MYTHTRQIVRPQPDHVYDSLPGMKKTFFFQAVREGVLLMRSFSCWCCACFRAWGAGIGTMDSSYHCQQCESPQLIWNEASIERTDAAGISNMRKRSLAKARQLTKQLQAHFARSNVPVWVAVQNRGEEDQDQCALHTNCPLTDAISHVRCMTLLGFCAGTGLGERFE